MIANKRKTKRDPFAAEINLRRQLPRWKMPIIKDPKTMSMAELIRAIDQCAGIASGLSKRP